MSLNRDFHRLTIAEVVRETPDSVSVRFDSPARALSGVCIPRRLPARGPCARGDRRRGVAAQLRQFCAAPREGQIKIAIKQTPGGRFSGWANAALVPGQSIDVLPPMGRFVLPDGHTAPYYVALAGGSGITPVLSILKHALIEIPDSRATLLYGNRDSRSIMFLEELAGLKNRYMGRLELYHFLEYESEEIELFNGRLDTAKCEEVFTSLVDVASADAVFICGPGPMMDAAEEALAARGVAKEKVFVERFTTGSVSAVHVARDDVLQKKASSGWKLAVALDPWPPRAGSVRCGQGRGRSWSAVQAAARGWPAPYACKGGVCSTCRAKPASLRR